MDWRSLEARVDSSMRAAYGETVRLTFMKNGTTDPTRPQWLGRAILHTGGDDSHAVGDGMRTRLSAGQAELFLDRGTYDGPMPIGQDVVRAMDRDGLPRWEVSGVSDRYSSLIVVSLNQA